MEKLPDRMLSQVGQARKPVLRHRPSRRHEERSFAPIETIGTPFGFAQGKQDDKRNPHVSPMEFVGRDVSYMRTECGVHDRGRIVACAGPESGVAALYSYVKLA